MQTAVWGEIKSTDGWQHEFVGFYDDSQLCATAMLLKKSVPLLKKYLYYCPRGPIADYADRLFARILPVASSIAATGDLGIPTSHVIAMQGPFSKELNCALIHEFDIRVMVTKASGTAGGFWEKVEAAQACGIELVVIDRPLEEAGCSVAEARQLLVDDLGL